MNDTEFKRLLNREAERFQDAYYEDWKNGRTVFQQIFMNESNPKMNDALDYKISVMQAYRAGKEIEHRAINDVAWLKCEHPSPFWNWMDFDYRVKAQEPRRAFISTGDSGTYFFAYNPITEMKKIEHIKSENPDCLVEFIEVTPDVRDKLSL